MEDLFRSYWWLLFPLGFFIFGSFDRWLAYKRSRDRLDLLREYTAQGKEPPAELLRTATLADDDDDDDDEWMSRRRYRHERRMRRFSYSPYAAWRTFFITGAVALGFWLSSEYADVPGTDGPFRLVAIILTCVSLAHLAIAVFASTFRGR